MGRVLHHMTTINQETTMTTNLTTTPTQDAINTMTGEKPAMLQVYTVPQKCSAGTELVTAATRASEGKTIENANRMRCIIIPELAVDNVPSKFQSLVMDALRRTAKKQLDAMWKADAMLQAVPAAVWSVDSLLLFAAKTAESTRLTKENTLEWFLTSELCKHLMAPGADGKANPKKYEDWKLRVVGMAAPVLQLNEAQCNVTIAAIGKFESDAASPMAAQMIEKLTKRIEALQQAAAEIEEV